jgi:hypothetical protein
MTVATESKALSSTERRALEKLVKNDYETLRTELDVMYQQACKEARDEYERTLAKTAAGRDAKAEKIREALARISHKATADIEKVVATADREGYRLHVGGTDQYGNPKSFKSFQVSLHEITDAKAEKNLKSELERLGRQYQTATTLMRRQELTVQRELLLTALTSDTAKDFLTQIPSARDLFTAAAIEA